LAKHVSPIYLLLISAALIELAVFGVRRLSKLSRALHRQPPIRSDEAPIGGSVFSGITHALKSPYLINVSVYVLLFTITSTFLTSSKRKSPGKALLIAARAQPFSPASTYG
jgi:AAA family ATP:ADP antiporter